MRNVSKKMHVFFLYYYRCILDTYYIFYSRYFIMMYQLNKQCLNKRFTSNTLLKRKILQLLLQVLGAYHGKTGSNMESKVM